MNRHLLIGLLLLLTAVTASAQENLVGRVYHSPNILDGQMSELADGARVMREARRETYAKSTEKKGSKLTPGDRVQIELRFRDGLARMDAMSRGLQVAVSLTFRSAGRLLVEADYRVDDEALEAAGYDEKKRQAVRAALARRPKKTKASYRREGRLVIVSYGSACDTLRLSPDGQRLQGRLRGKLDVTLQRTR